MKGDDSWSKTPSALTNKLTNLTVLNNNNNINNNNNNNNNNDKLKTNLLETNLEKSEVKIVGRCGT